MNETVEASAARRVRLDDASTHSYSGHLCLPHSRSVMTSEKREGKCDTILPPCKKKPEGWLRQTTGAKLGVELDKILEQSKQRHNNSVLSSMSALSATGQEVPSNDGQRQSRTTAELLKFGSVDLR